MFITVGYFGICLPSLLMDLLVCHVTRLYVSQTIINLLESNSHYSSNTSSGIMCDAQFSPSNGHASLLKTGYISPDVSNNIKTKMHCNGFQFLKPNRSCHDVAFAEFYVQKQSLFHRENCIFSLEFLIREIQNFVYPDKVSKIIS